MLDEILLSSVKARVEELDVQAETLEHRIAALQDELEETKRAREEVRKERVRVLAPLAPVSRVPYEVLARIFVLGDNRYDGYGVSPKTKRELYWALHYPMRLSHVNRQFRQVAITTARLWTNIYIRSVPLHPRNNLYLSRCQGCLLDIRVCRLLLANPPAAAINQLFQVVPLHRWRSLRMNVVMHHMRSFLCQVGPATNLKVLELKGDWYSEGTDETVDLLNPFEGQTPLLSSVTLYNASSRWSATMFSAVTSLSLTFTGAYSDTVVRDHLKLLQHATNLKALTILDEDETDIIDDVDDPVPSIVRLEVLESLTIGVRNPDLIHIILSSLHMPALLNFTLQRWNERYAEYAKVITVLTRNPYVAVKRLSLFNIYTDEAAVFVRDFPGIEELEIDNAAGIITRMCLAMRDTTEVFFPKLRCLKLVRGLNSLRLIDCTGELKQFLKLWRSKNEGPFTVLLPDHGSGAADEELLADMAGLADFEAFMPDYDCDTCGSDDDEDRYDTSSSDDDQDDDDGMEV